jgi:hypothetical protein
LTKFLPVQQAIAILRKGCSYFLDGLVQVPNGNHLVLL